MWDNVFAETFPEDADRKFYYIQVTLVLEDQAVGCTYRMPRYEYERDAFFKRVMDKIVVSIDYQLEILGYDPKTLQRR